MKLIRTGVFETNSSSCHSMAIVGRLQKKTPRDATITDIYGELGYTPMFDNVVWTVKFDNYLCIEQQLCNSQDKLWFLLTEVYKECTFDIAFRDEFYLKVKRWLSDICITLKEPEYDIFGDYVGEVLSQSIVSEEMFQTKEDLLTYLFNNDITIHIENDNSEIMQNWVDDPKETMDYCAAMYWCVSQYKCVRRKSWKDGVYLIYDVIKDDDGHYDLGYLLLDNGSKTLYKPTVGDAQASDWTVSLEVNKYEIS